MFFLIVKECSTNYKLSSTITDNIKFILTVILLPYKLYQGLKYC